MAYPELTTVNTSAGAHTLFTYVADVVPSFIPMVLLSIFAVIALGSYAMQRRLTGDGDLPVTVAVAAYITTIFMFIFSLIPTLVDTITMTVVVGVSVVSTMWLFFSRRDVI